MTSTGFIKKFKALPDFEKKNIIISSIFTVVAHIIIIIILTPSSQKEEEVGKKPNFIKAKILIKGEKDGVNSYNAKTNKIRTKKKKFLPDVTVKTHRNASPQKKAHKAKAVIKKKLAVDKNTVKLGKKKKDKVKTHRNASQREEKISDADRMKALLSLKKIALPSDKKSDKNGNLGKRKGGKSGAEDGNVTDPSKVLAGSLYERRVASKIKSKWKAPILDKNAKKLIYRIKIFIKKDGSFNFKVLKKSNNIFFNNSVDKVLKKIKKVESPAPKFQKYYKEKGLVINFFPKN